MKVVIKYLPVLPLEENMEVPNFKGVTTMLVSLDTKLLCWIQDPSSNEAGHVKSLSQI